MKRVKLKSELIKRFAYKKYGTQKNLANKIGVNPNNLYGWLNGNSEFPIEVAIKIADLMNVNVKDIRENNIKGFSDLEEEIISLGNVVEELKERVEELENESIFKKIFKRKKG